MAWREREVERRWDVWELVHRLTCSTGLTPHGNFGSKIDHCEFLDVFPLLPVAGRGNREYP